MKKLKGIFPAVAFASVMWLNCLPVNLSAGVPCRNGGNDQNHKKEQNMYVKQIDWQGYAAIAFAAGGYEAILVPGMGANLVKLAMPGKGVTILHTPQPDEMETFRGRPQIFGLPLLFPPNRIEDGTYVYNGRRYRYPITNPQQNNYLHGIIKSQPFEVAGQRIGEDFVEVEAVYRSNAQNDAIFRDFPHEFECRMLFRLSSAGLEHRVTFTNLSKEEMPLGVGYHTPLMVPFVDGSSADDCLLQLSAGKRWELSEDRLLPTGRLLELNDEEQCLRGKGLKPVGKPIECALTNEPIEIDGQPYRGAVLTDTVTGLRLFYEVDDNFRHWTLWNNGGEVNWVCPEPQTWATNAPNLNLPADVTGFQAIAPGVAWSAVSRIYVK